MEIVFLVIVAVAVLIGLSSLNSMSDAWDGCSCLLAVIAAVGILVVIGGLATVGVK